VVSYSPLEDRIAKLLGDRYELIELVGKGGFASVFRVRNNRLHRTEALKVLSEALTEDADFSKRFEQEARVAASLDHPHIVKIYDYGSAEDFVWFSMQFVDGPTVGRELRVRERFDDSAAARIAVGVLDALQYSHARGVIHRDIKPDNILLDREGRPYLTDFGVAKSQAGLVKTQAGTLLGSPAYMSPEQLQGKPLDGRSDLYSLGVTLYRMLAGGLPFLADDTFRATMKRLSEPPEPLLSRCPDVNPLLAEIVMRSLERDAALRYLDATAMREELESFLVDVTPPRVRLSTAAARADGTTPTGVRTPTPGGTPSGGLSLPSPTATRTPTPPPVPPVLPPEPPTLVSTPVAGAPPPPFPAAPVPTPLDVPPNPPTPAKSAGRRIRPLGWVGLGAAALAAVLVIFLFATRQQRSAATEEPVSTEPQATPAISNPAALKASPAAASSLAPTEAPAPSVAPTQAPAALEEPTAPRAPTLPRPTRKPSPPATVPPRHAAEAAPVPMGPARPPKTMAETIALAPLVLPPEIATLHHNESVGLTVTVAADGTVKSAKVISEVCPECDRAALDSIKRSRFRPALDADGKPMESTLAISVRIP
jgi:eukaryotic-like serine/threonine-protein kinase